MKQLEDAFNTNTKVFSDGIQMLEAQLEVARRVAQGLLEEMHPRGSKLMGSYAVRVTMDGQLDWNGYLKEYIEELTEKEEQAKAPPILVESDPEQPTIFGGG